MYWPTIISFFQFSHMQCTIYILKYTLTLYTSNPYSTMHSVYHDNNVIRVHPPAAATFTRCIRTHAHHLGTHTIFNWTRFGPEFLIKHMSAARGFGSFVSYNDSFPSPVQILLCYTIHNIVLYTYNNICRAQCVDYITLEIHLCVYIIYRCIIRTCVENRTTAYDG